MDSLTMAAGACTLARAERAARDGRIPALTAAIESASLVLNTSAARLIANGEEGLLLFEEIEALLAAKALLERPFASTPMFHTSGPILDEAP
jgi:hypothetical protein